MWDVWDVRSWGCVMFGMWDVRDVGCRMLIYKMILHVHLCNKSTYNT